MKTLAAILFAASLAACAGRQSTGNPPANPPPSNAASPSKIEPIGDDSFGAALTLGGPIHELEEDRETAFGTAHSHTIVMSDPAEHGGEAVIAIDFPNKMWKQPAAVMIGTIKGTVKGLKMTLDREKTAQVGAHYESVFEFHGTSSKGRAMFGRGRAIGAPPRAYVLMFTTDDQAALDGEAAMTFFTSFKLADTM